MGASGSGVTTLGAAISVALGCAHFDTDDFYWIPTDPPFRTKYSIEERIGLLLAAFERAATTGWVLSGELVSWGSWLIPHLDLVVFISTETALRVQRIRVREDLRFGAHNNAPGGWHHDEYEAFLDWAASYEAGTQEGRSRARHEVWVDHLPCPVLRLDGARPVKELVEDVLKFE